jgi:hypothetical protein
MLSPWVGRRREYRAHPSGLGKVGISPSGPTALDTVSPAEAPLPPPQRLQQPLEPALAGQGELGRELAPFGSLMFKSSL